VHARPDRGPSIVLPAAEQEQPVQQGRHFGDGPRPGPDRGVGSHCRDKVSFDGCRNSLVYKRFVRKPQPASFWVLAGIGLARNVLRKSRSIPPGAPDSQPGPAQPAGLEDSGLPDHARRSVPVQGHLTRPGHPRTEGMEKSLHANLETFLPGTSRTW